MMFQTVQYQLKVIEISTTKNDKSDNKLCRKNTP